MILKFVWTPKSGGTTELQKIDTGIRSGLLMDYPDADEPDYEFDCA